MGDRPHRITVLAIVRSLILLATIAFASACAEVPAARPSSRGPAPTVVATVWSHEYDLHVNNSTPLTVVVLVNGHEAGRVGRTEKAFDVNELPSFPWSTELTTTTGRRLLTLAVDPANVGHAPGEVHGVADRVDLSCGRIDVWVGPPLGGPVPGPGKPGDCDL